LTWWTKWGADNERLWCSEEKVVCVVEFLDGYWGKSSIFTMPEKCPYKLEHTVMGDKKK